MMIIRRICSYATRRRRVRPCSASISARRPARTPPRSSPGWNRAIRVRRTAWGTIIVAEEHGIDGGLYEILDPVHITTAIAVTNRATERFIAGSQQLGTPDNVAFQPHTGNLVVLADGPTSIVRADGTTAAWERSVDLPARRPRRRRAVGWMRPLRVTARY